MGVQESPREEAAAQALETSKLLDGSDKLPTMRKSKAKKLKKKIVVGNYEPQTTSKTKSSVYFVISMVFLLQGLYSLADLATSYFFKDELKMTPTQVSAVRGTQWLPWTIKPLYGFCSDAFPIFGHKRRPYLFLSGILGVLSWLLLAFWVTKGDEAVFAVLLGSLAVALSNVMAEALVVEQTRHEDSQEAAARLQALCWGTRSVGSVFAAYFSGFFLDYFKAHETFLSPARTVFFITAFFPALLTILALVITEEKSYVSNRKQNLLLQVGNLYRVISHKHIYRPALFIFFVQATPTASAAFFFFFTNNLGIDPEFLGKMNLIQAGGTLLGVIVFQTFLKSIKFRKILFMTTILSSGFGLTELALVTHKNREWGIPDKWFCIGDSAVQSIMGEVAMMPILVLAARICPKGVEGALFALLTSVMNVGSLVSFQSGALCMELLGITETNFDNMWILVLIANLSTLVPLVFLPLVSNNPDTKDLDMGASKAAEGGAIAAEKERLKDDAPSEKVAIEAKPVVVSRSSSQSDDNS